MNIERLTNRAREALGDGQALAQRMGSPEIYPEHILLGLIGQKDGVVSAVLRRAGRTPDVLQKQTQAALERRPKVAGQSNLHYSSAIHQVFG